MPGLTFDLPETKGLVSIVIAAYKAERFIRDALDSIAAQTYSRWELIVVEDGSHDGAERIVAEFAQSHPTHRVEFVRSERNRGLGPTRNHTFALSAGEFVAILDADDRWLPGFLSAAVDGLKTSGKDVAYATSVMVEDGSELLLGTWGPLEHELRDFPQSLFNRNFITPSATLVRRKTLAAVGPWDTFTYAEDLSYWMRCIAAGKQFHHVPGCHCLYRKNHAGAMTQCMSAMMEGVAVVVERFKDAPGTRPRTTRKYASNAFAWAAHLHASSSPEHDPSADAQRAAGLMWKAWRLRPKRVLFLLKALRMAAAALVRRPASGLPSWRHGAITDSIAFERGESSGLVSIVIPAHRAAAFIGATLESIGAQTYPHWETIVVEDGSPDGTERIVRDFAKRFPQHRVEYRCNDRNRRAAYTRNAAAKLAAGEFVALLDADDRWLPDHLEAAVSALQKSGKDVVYSTVLIVEDQTERLLGIWGPNRYELADFAQSFVARNLVPTSAAVMRRSVLADVGPWNSDYRCCEDFEFWLRCVAAGKQFEFLGGCSCLYRKNHDGAVTQRWCGTWEESATITERFVRLPGSRLNTSLQYAAASYELAARLHAQTDPRIDSSADRSRAARLYWKAWRLQPRRTSYLFKSLWVGAKQWLRPRRKEAAQPSSAVAPATTPACAAA